MEAGLGKRGLGVMGVKLKIKKSAFKAVMI